MSSPAGVSGNCLFLYMYWCRALWYCLLGSDFYTVYVFHKFTSLSYCSDRRLLSQVCPKLDIPLHLYGIYLWLQVGRSWRILLNRSDILCDHIIGSRPWVIPWKDGHVRPLALNMLIFLQWYTVAKRTSLHFISTAWKGRKSLKETCSSQRNLTTSSIRVMNKKTKYRSW